MPRPINPLPIRAREYAAIVARLDATGGDVAVVMTEFNRGRTTIARLLPRAQLP